MTRLHFAHIAFAAAMLCVGAAQATPVKAQQIVHNTANYEITVRYPHMGMKAIDDQIAAWAKNYAASFAADTADKPVDESPWNTDVSYKVMRNDSQMFEVLFTLYTFTGGAHPNTELVSQNFLVSDGYQVDLVDIVGRGGIAKVSELAIANLIHEIGSGSTEPMTSDDQIQEGAGPSADNFRNFTITRTALVLHFNEYAVAAYAAGPQETSIPLSKLRGVIRPDWRAPLPSFDCTKAASAVEKAICSDAALSKLDRDMASAFRLWLAWFPENPAKVADLRVMQRNWLADRATRCHAAAASGMVACLTRVYQARIKQLQKPPI